MKITIIGLSSSGKTTLAKKISKILGIYHIHLDRFWFEEGGKNIGKNTSLKEKNKIRATIKRRVLDEISKNSWVSDGFYSRVQDEIAKRADTIIFLNTPLWKRLVNHTFRIFSPKDHEELTIWDLIVFYPELIKRQIKHQPKLTEFIKKYKNKVVTLRSNKEIEFYLNKITTLL